MVDIKSAIRRVVRTLNFSRFDHKRVFQHIYDKRYWGDQESVSGIGSSLEQTAPIRRELPDLFRKHGIKSLIDAPCGDLHWMQHVLREVDVSYTGGDIVPDIVHSAENRKARQDDKFIIFDITDEKFPDVDLWICRDVLFHFSYNQIRKTLANFVSSNVEYILVTTHTAPNISNRNIATGDFRRIDIFKPPFSFPRSIVIDRFDDYVPPAEPREMVLIRRTDLAKSAW